MQTLTATFEGLNLQAEYYAPKAEDKSTVLFCLPGGGASAQYFDLAPGNSFADRMTRLGYHVITMDHPGTVTNPLPANHPFLKPRKSADYIAEALAQFLKNAGLSELPVIGVGHSMGGMIATLVQARHMPFCALALLGSSAGGLDWGLSDEEKTYIEKPDALARDLETLTLNKFKSAFPPGTGGPSGKSITFGGETEALTQRLRETSCELYSAGGMMSMTRGSFRLEVNAINVPMFFAFGDNDIGIPPQDAPKDYINAPSAELCVLDNTGHNHFAFSTIETLCKGLDHWASDLV